VFIFQEIHICIRDFLTDIDIVWLLSIRNRPFSNYPLISDII
jgi:hypothetical protein